MELIYSYVHSCWGEEFNLGLNLSRKYHADFIFNEKKIKIKKTPNKNMESFFGSNISNVSAIIGRNGVGKSTILNMLGLQRLDHNDLYRNDGTIWFCLYHIQDNDFAIEGVAPVSFFDTSIQHHKDGYFAYILNDSDGELIYDCKLQDYEEDFQNSTVVLYNPTSKVRNKFEREYGNHGFKRAYINQKSSYLYQFLCDDFNYFGVDKESRFLLKVPTAFKNNRSNAGARLKLFEDKDFYTDDFFFPGFKNQPLIEDIKKKFILHIIEIIINDYFVNAIKPTNLEFLDEPIEKDKADLFLKKIGDVYSDDMLDYEKIKSYLMRIMSTFQNVAQNIIGVNEETNWPEIVRVLNSFPKGWFSRKGHYYLLSVPCIHKDFSAEASFLMDEMDKSNFVTSVHPEPPLMSSGQQALAFKISAIHAELTFQITSQHVRNVILLIDEYEEHLHPEWARLFFCYLIKLIGRFKESVTVQIIIATHSPYIISDLPKENVIKISHTKNKRVIEDCHFGFGSNIYDIICDNFFLNNTMGEFAYDKINSMIVTLNDDSEISDIQYNEFQYLVSIIDDVYLKSHLQGLIDAKIPSSVIPSEIAILKKRLAKLNEMLGND